ITSAPPIVGQITAFKDGNVVTVAALGPLATPSAKNSGDYAIATDDPATQLRSLIRENTRIDDVSVNRAPPANADQDHVHITVGGGQVVRNGALAPPADSLFLSPVFSTTALNDADMPRSGTQFFRASNAL